MKTVSLVFFKGRGWLSALIRFQTRGQFSHVGVLFNDDNTFFEAWAGSGKKFWRNSGVAKKLNWKADPDVVVIPIRVTDTEAENMRAFADERVGKRYDYRSVLRFLTRIKPVNNRRFFCSELALDIFTAGGIRLMAAPSSLVSPAVLWFSPVIR